MSANNFLPFANDPGATVQSQVTWAANPVVGTGFQAGIADESQCNKAWRQSSVMAYVLAQFISDTLGVDVLDDGAPSVIVGNLKLAAANASRKRLTAPSDFYVSSTGNDANPGTVGSPWLTLQHAMNYLQMSVDLAGQIATVHVANGTTYDGFTVDGPFVGSSGPGSVILLGNTGTPANCIIISNVTCKDGAQLTLQGFKFVGAGSNDEIDVIGYGSEINMSLCDFGAATGSHMSATYGGTINITGNYAVSGGAFAHIQATAGAIIRTTTTSTVAVSNTPAFSLAYAQANLIGNIITEFFTFTGTGATGQRYNGQTNASIFTNGGGANKFPGNVAGAVSTGGLYT